MEPDPPKRKRRWFQFSMRTLLIGVVIVAVPCALLGRKIEQKRREREASKAFKALGGQVWYDYETDDEGHRIGKAIPFGPAWMRKLLGDDFFCEIVGAELAVHQCGDVASEYVSRFAHLQQLYLIETNLSNAGIANLKEMTELRVLDVSRNFLVTDAGLTVLHPMSHLKRLDVFDTQVTDAGVRNLQIELPHCEILREREGVPDGVISFPSAFPLPGH